LMEEMVEGEGGVSIGVFRLCVVGVWW
jgi:hypothetical protein